MADKLDETIEELEGIVDNCRRRKSRAGYFASMYLAVTREIKRAIEAGVFDDGPRMEQLDIVFARRYIDAFNADRTNIRPSTSWAISFDGADTRRPIVLQQLLTGMSRKAVNGDHFCLAVVGFPEYFDLFFLFSQPPSQCVGSLPGHNQNCIARVLNMVL